MKDYLVVTATKNKINGEYENFEPYMERVTIEYLTASGNCKSVTGLLMEYCDDGDVIVSVNGKKKKGMPVQWF